ncbi:radical SAM protein [Inediibacterium massiliense]|uniref:radical SAM protein n=1 Tax=Inediibacterium massiliense TaxID=1658111 RepID=UPI0006B4A8AC|nr:radical SAM protein [Inediibacterium massiliense]
MPSSKTYHPLNLLEIQLTSDCNLSCIYCGNSPKLRSDHKNWLPLEVIQETILKLKPKKVLFTGGEVILAWERLLEALEFVKDLDIEIIISSNLTLLNYEDIDLLIDQYNVHTFHTSFNDYDLQMTNRVRGGDLTNREKLMDNIRYITQKRKKKLKVETILLKDTISDLPNIHKLLYDLGVKHHKIEFLIPTGYASWDMMLPYNKLVDTVLKTYKEKQKGCILELTCCYLTPCIEEASKLYEIDDPEFIFHKCIDGKESAYLLANGDFVPCFLLPNHLMNTNVYTNDVLDVWNNNKVFRAVRDEANQECTACDFFHKNNSKTNCNNGCWALMYMETKSFEHNCPKYIKEKLSNL